MLLPNNELDAYALSDKGRALVVEGIKVCLRHGLRWKDLWSPQMEAAQAARDALGLNLGAFPSPELGGAIMGAHAFTEVLKQVAFGEANLADSVGNLRKLGLVGYDNILFASERLGVDVGDIVVLLLPTE